GALESGEVLLEHLQQLVHGDIELLVVAPGFARFQKAAVNAFDLCRDLEAKIGVDEELSLVQRAIEGGRQEPSGYVDGHTLTDAIFPTGPAGINQPATHIVFGNQRAQQVAVDRRMSGHEWRAKTSREGRFRIGYASFCTSHLRGVSGQEVKH